jgi:hypothetical protein
MTPPIITAKRTARIAEPNTKSSLLYMLANVTHELMFHDTIEEDSSSFEPCRKILERRPTRNEVTGRAWHLTDALSDHHRSRYGKTSPSLAHTNHLCYWQKSRKSGYFDDSAAPRPLGQIRKVRGHF